MAFWLLIVLVGLICVVLVTSVFGWLGLVVAMVFLLAAIVIVEQSA